MLTELPDKTLVDFIIGDFEAAWDCLASNDAPPSRGNFMFARQALVLLEVACRICEADSSKQALPDFSASMATREPRYFTQLPGVCWRPRRPEFSLPSPDGRAGEQLIGALFELVRHGQAHQYQQIPVVLTDGKGFSFKLSGPGHGQHLRSLEQYRAADHLRAELTSSGDTWVRLNPGLLLIDVRDAIRETALLERGLAFARLSRSPGETFDFDSAALGRALRAGGHLC